MAKLVWDKSGEHFYEAGVRKGVLYNFNKVTSTYDTGSVWNGLTGVTESPEGAEPTALYADDIKYLNLMSAEEWKGTITAYTFPKEFEKCDGYAELAEGVTIGQQDREIFGFSYQTRIGNDTEGSEKGYKIHCVYGCIASPSEKAYATINDSPEAVEFSWDVNATPVEVPGHKPTATLIIDSTKVSEKGLKAVEDLLYGSDSDGTAKLPLPSEILSAITSAGK